jgi:hypothetical protein
VTTTCFIVVAEDREGGGVADVVVVAGGDAGACWAATVAGQANAIKMLDMTVGATFRQGGAHLMLVLIRRAIRFVLKWTRALEVGPLSCDT